MNVAEIFEKDQPVWLIVQNRLQYGSVTRMHTDGVQILVDVAHFKGHMAIWCVPVDRVAKRDLKKGSQEEADDNSILPEREAQKFTGPNLA